MINLVDSHCHLDHLNLDPYGQKLENALLEAKQHDVSHILTVSVTLEAFPKMLKIAEAYDHVTCSVGVQPSEEVPQEPTVEQLVELAQYPKVVAIGEAGLDFYYQSTSKEQQIERLRAHVRAARIVKKPLIIHLRDASDLLLKILKEERAEEVGGVMHCFTDTLAVAKKTMALGFYISFSGIVTFKKAEQVQMVAREIPLDRMLIETDAPYLAPVPMRGKSNVPAYLQYTAKYLAQLRNVPYEELARITTENFYRFIGGSNHG